MNFVVARAKSEFYTLTNTAPTRKDGGKEINIPPDFVTALPHHFACAAEHRKIQRYWQNKHLPFLEHELFDWVPLELGKGTPESEHAHNYVH